MRLKSFSGGFLACDCFFNQLPLSRDEYSSIKYTARLKAELKLPIKGTILSSFSLCSKDMSVLFIIRLRQIADCEPCALY